VNDTPPLPGLMVERDGPVAVVTLDHPARLNALGRESCAALVRTADPEVRAVVLTGRGAGFCAGADLQDGAFTPQPGESRGAATRRFLEEYFNPVAQAWYELDRPVVAAVNGVAAGGGVGLALTADFVLAATGSSFVQVFTPKLALVPDMGCSWLLPRRVGFARAKSLALLGDRLDGKRAAEWGLADACLADAQLLPEALILARRLAAGPMMAHSAVKHLFGDSQAFADALATEARLQEQLADHPDHAEGLLAFVEKRQPRYG
jgi:2-(1,2-epoxy-1,2-dihydrophenyl)acetyl-CoA isomerase